MIRMACAAVALSTATPVSFGQTAAWSGYGGDPQHTALSPRISRFQRGGQNEAENDKSDSHRVTSGDSGSLQLGPIISFQSASQGSGVMRATDTEESVAKQAARIWPARRTSDYSNAQLTLRSKSAHR